MKYTAFKVLNEVCNCLRRRNVHCCTTNYLSIINMISRTQIACAILYCPSTSSIDCELKCEYIHKRMHAHKSKHQQNKNQKALR